MTTGKVKSAREHGNDKEKLMATIVKMDDYIHYKQKTEERKQRLKSSPENPGSLHRERIQLIPWTPEELEML